MHARALALGLLAFGVSTARAGSEPDIAPECGSRAAFDQALRERLGDDVPLGSVLVAITRSPSRSRLRVQVGSDVRELEDASCTSLFGAAVVIAVAMLTHEPPLPPPAPAAPAPEPPSPAPASRRAHPRLSLGAGVGLNVGTLPRPVAALELESKALWRYLGVSLSLRYLSPTTETIVNDDKGVRLHALGAGVSGIFRPSPLWEARLGFAVQRLSGDGTGSIVRKSTDSAWAAGPTLALAFVPLLSPPFWAGLGAEGQLNVVRGHFEILHYYRSLSEDSYAIYDVPWLAASAFVRLGLVW
jgi:hypothetical protein